MVWTKGDILLILRITWLESLIKRVLFMELESLQNKYILNLLRQTIKPILQQFYISIPPENIRKPSFLTFSGGIEIE